MQWRDIMPKCKKCGEQFPNAITVDGVRKKTDTRRYCFECSPYKKGNTRDLTKPFKNSKEKSAEYFSEYYRKRTDRKLELIALKGGKCQVCGYDKCTDALVFHHRNPAEKKFPLSKQFIWNRKWETLIEELEKCDLLCCRCHCELHAAQHCI